MTRRAPFKWTIEIEVALDTVTTGLVKRAERAGRGAAIALLSECDPSGVPSADRVLGVATRALRDPTSPSDAAINAAGKRAFVAHLGDNQLAGRALDQALTAYDRGYRAVLSDYLEASNG